MPLHIFRVTVSGQFDGLDESTRSALLTEAADHVVALAAFTPSGTLTYDLPLVSFSYRYEIRVDDEDHDQPASEAAARAEAAALADLATRGIGVRHLRVQATDMADVWQRQRGRGGGRRRQ